MNKKGMEMWQLLLIILGIILLLLAIAWYGVLKGQLGDIITRLGNL